MTIRNPIVLGAIVVAAVFAGVWYFAGREIGLTTVNPPAAHEPAAPAARAPAPARAAVSATPPDSRLQALMVSPDNGLIEFVKDADGKVIREVDRDPSSARFGEPTREYTYLGNQVVGLTSYKNLGNQIQVSRIMVAFRPDGSIEQYRQTTDYGPARKSR